MVHWAAHISISVTLRHYINNIITYREMATGSRVLEERSAMAEMAMLLDMNLIFVALVW